MVGKIAYQPQRHIRLVRKQALKRLVKRGWRMVKVVVPLDTDIVHIISVLTDGKVSVVQHALLIWSAITFGNGA
jgi:hypothetical protein